MSSLVGKVILITGASRGIGVATVSILYDRPLLSLSCIDED